MEVSEARLRSLDAGATVALRVFVATALTTPGAKLSDDLLDAYTKSVNDLPGIAFACEMLVDATCAEPCDFNSAFHATHAIAAAANGVTPCFLYDPDRKPLARTPYKGSLTRHGQMAQTVFTDAALLSECSVVG